MSDSLTDEQRAFVTVQAQTTGRAIAVLELLRGLNGPATIAVLTLAVTTVIESNYAAEHRLGILNTMLAETITEWAAAAAMVTSAGMTRQ